MGGGIGIALMVLLGCCGPAEPQSLAEAARKEAERRKQIDAAGVRAKTLGDGSAAGEGARGGIAVFSPAMERKKGDEGEEKRRQPLQSFRKVIEKLDREIREAEDKVTLLRRRAESARRAQARGGSPKSSRGEALGWQLDSWEVRLRRLKAERRTKYEEGLRAGHLPGELEGRGIRP